MKRMVVIERCVSGSSGGFVGGKSGFLVLHNAVLVLC